MKRKGHGEGTRERYEKLTKLGKQSFVTQSGMSKLLNDVKINGLPESFCRSTQYRARGDICSSDTLYGPLVVEKELHLVDGETLTIGFQNPLAFFEYHCRNSPHYAEIVKQTLERSPCNASTPWRIILYSDGVNPSDGLAKNRSRTMSTYYWSFAEFGEEVLCHEQVWGTVCCMRSNKAKKLSGGEAQLCYHVLEQFFGDTHDIRRAGVNVNLHGSGQRAKIFARVGIILADEPALKEMIDCKGHGGTKPCPCCRNATSHKPPGGGEPLHLSCAWAVPITETDFTKFKLFSNEGIRTACCRLSELKLAATTTEDAKHLKKVEQMYGYNHNPWSIILEEEIWSRTC